MSTLSQFAGGIKSVQRGAITITGGAGVNSATATITAVNTAKSELRFLGMVGDNETSLSPSGRVELTNSTTVTAHRQNNTPYSRTQVLGWELTEWY